MTNEKDANGTPVENQAPASQQTVEIELVDGRKITGVRWFQPSTQQWRCEVEIDGKLYVGHQLTEGENEGKWELE